MANRRALFKQADMQRALKAALAAGMKPASVEVGPSGVRVYFVKDNDGQPRLNTWDRVLCDDPEN